jgi:hypothetical protein
VRISTRTASPAAADNTAGRPRQAGEELAAGRRKQQLDVSDGQAARSEGVEEPPCA